MADGHRNPVNARAHLATVTSRLISTLNLSAKINGKAEMLAAPARPRRRHPPAEHMPYLWGRRARTYGLKKPTTACTGHTRHLPLMLALYLERETRRAEADAARRSSRDRRSIDLFIHAPEI